MESELGLHSRTFSNASLQRFSLGYTTTAINILIQIRENVNNALKTGHSLTLS